MSRGGDGKKFNHIICIDFETGGLDPMKSAITEIGCVAIRSDTFEQLWSYQAYITPHYTRKKPVKTLRTKKQVAQQTELFKEDEFTYEEKALTYSNISLDMLQLKGKDIRVVAAEISELIKEANLDGGTSTKPFLLGQNILFDSGFLQQLAEVGGIDLSKILSGKKDFYGNFQPEYVDTLRQVQTYFALDETVTKHSLSHVCDLLGIELIEAHSALDDVYATIDLYKALTDRMRSGDGLGGKEKKEKTRAHFLF